LKAAVLTSFGRPLEFRELPKPAPGPAEVTVKMKTSGICHSDLHNIEGDWSVLPELPIVPGHEGVGIVSEAGEDVRNVRVGDRVGVWFYNNTCRICDYCLSGNENYCEQRVMTGFSVDGTFAEYVKVAGDFAIKIPAGLSDIEAAPLTDAGLTAWRAVKTANVRPGDCVAVYGLGGVGHLVLQFAELNGAEVFAVDIGEGKLRMAERLGADRVFDASDASVGSTIKYEFGGVNAAICCAPSLKAYEQAMFSLKTMGTLVAIGLPPGNVELPVLNTVFFGIHIVGSFIGSRRDLIETLSVAAKGRVKSVVRTYRFGEVNEAIKDLKEANVEGRPVMVFEES
jgi:alcohol dehydrogenase, propanol-preferring